MPKKAIAIGSGMIVFGSALAILAPQYWVFILGRFIMGFGGAVYVVYFLSFILNRKRALRSMLSTVLLFGNVGGMLAMMVVGPVIAMGMQNLADEYGVFCRHQWCTFILWLVVDRIYINTTNDSTETSAESYSFATALAC